MAIVQKIIYEGQRLTQEQISEIDAAAKRPLTFDEDCPALSPDQLRKFSALAVLQRKQSKQRIRKA